MNYEISKARLKDYFSTVTYIDDRFDQCIVDEPIDFGDEEFEGIPPLPAVALNSISRDTGELKKEPSAEDRDTEVNLSAILTALNDEKYAGVRFTPVLFKDNLEKKVLVKKIQDAPLTLIDWDLGTGEKAFDFINQLFETAKQLKVIVVYTGNYIEAINAIREDARLKDCEEISTKYFDFNCYRCNYQSLIIVAAKQSYNLESILNIIPEVFIDNCGLMPVALLDFMASAQHVSDELFGSFCHPFEDVYWLQMYFSELNEADIPSAITEFIQNKICESCDISPQISDEMFAYYKDRLITLVEMPDEEAAEVFHQALKALRPHLQSSNIDFCDTLLTADYAQIKEACISATSDSKTWGELIEKFSAVLSTATMTIVEQKITSLLDPFANLQASEEWVEKIDQLKSQIHEKITAQVNCECEIFRTEIFPVLVQILVSSPDILYSGVELVRNLKYRNYDNPDLNVLLSDGKTMKKEEKENYLRNKFHYGDVLIRKKKRAATEYLLCISPPCDVCRPGKVKLNISFIRGIEIPEQALNVRRKENKHVSILPIAENGQEHLKYVTWRLFDIVKFDMGKKEDYGEICSYSRPFMMSEQYSRQIGNLFTAYFSRAGVDELFMKSAGSLRTIFK